MRARILIPLLLLAGCAAPTLRRIPPPEETPEQIISEGKIPATILWAVHPQRKAEEVLDILRQTLGRDSQFKMTVALPMELLNGLESDAKERLSRWQGDGRIQITLLPQGGFPSPLLTRFSWHLGNSFGVRRSSLRKAPDKILASYDISQIFVRSAETWKKNFPPEQEAPGFTLPLGLSDENALNGLLAADASWVVIAATGPSIYFRNANGLDIYAAKPLTEIPQEWLAGFYTLDEHYGTSMERSPSLLEEIAERHGKGEFESVSPIFWKMDVTSGAAAYRYGENNALFFPHWGSPATALALWETEAQKQYWFLMFKSHEDIAAYQNSGKARLEDLDKLWGQYFSLLSSSWTWALRKEIQETPEAAKEEELRQNLSGLYKELQKVSRIALPASLAVSLWSSPETGSQTSTGGTAGSHVLSFEDFYDTEPAGQALDLKNFSISWTPAEFIFEIAAPAAAEAELSAEIYIDLNRRPYEGQEKNLSGSLRAAPSDFWEYALQWNGSKVSIYRHEAGGVRRRKEAPYAQERKNDVWTLRVPREWIPGKDPARWGWALCLSAASSADCLQTYSVEPDTLFFTKPR